MISIRKLPFQPIPAISRGNCRLEHLQLFLIVGEIILIERLEPGVFRENCGQRQHLMKLNFVFFSRKKYLLLVAYYLISIKVRRRSSKTSGIVTKSFSLYWPLLSITELSEDPDSALMGAKVKLKIKEVDNNVCEARLWGNIGLLLLRFVQIEA